MNDTQFVTEGEKLLGRKLEKEVRGGVAHYVTGQHRAVIVEEATGYHAVLSFVNVLGEATQILCKRPVLGSEGELGAWELAGRTSRRAGMLVRWGTVPIPQSFELTEKMRDALDEAQRVWEEEQGLG